MIESAAGLHHSFVVRLWYEPGGADTSGQWRGSVEHVPSGQRRYFIALGDLTEFVASKLAMPSREPAAQLRYRPLPE
jgi:hypothetical protein